ncbi:MAG TPA: hypothetical protein V6D11_29400 [Waterburya sp.]|jgi:hypothetical protein
MTYFNQLYPWCIIKPLPNLQRQMIARFRRRNEAESHLQVIRRLLPGVTYMIIFDPMLEQDENTDVSDRTKRTVASDYLKVPSKEAFTQLQKQLKSNE